MNGNWTSTIEEHEEAISTPAMVSDHAAGRRARQILVVDGDLGLVLWFAGSLVEAGYAAFPAPSIKTALALVGRLDRDLDVLVVNQRMPGGGRLAVRLKTTQPALKIAALADAAEPRFGPVPFADVTIPRPARGDRETATRLVDAIDHLLTLNRAA